MIVFSVFVRSSQSCMTRQVLFSILQYVGKYKKTPVIQHMQLPLYKSFIYLNNPALNVAVNYTQYTILSHRMKIKQRDMVCHMAEISSNYQDACIYENG